MYRKLSAFVLFSLVLLSPISAKAETDQLSAQPVAQIAEVNTIMMDFLTQSMVKVGNQVLDAYLIKKFNLPAGYSSSSTGTTYNYGTSYTTGTSTPYTYSTTTTPYTYSTTSGLTLTPTSTATSSATSTTTYSSYGDYVPGMESEQMIPVQ